MQKLFKRFAVVLMVALAALCMAAFLTACNNDGNETEEYATDTFTVIVLDENGNPIDGTTFGEADYDPDNHQVTIQFCTNYGCTMVNPEVGTDGKATIQVENVAAFLHSLDDEVELHVLGVTKVGYKKEYGWYSVDKIPLEITVTLEKA